MSDVLYGVNSVFEALRANRRSGMELFLLDDSGKRSEQVVKEARRLKVPVKLVARPELSKLAGNDGHQGVVLRSSGYPFVEFEDLLDSIDRYHEDSDACGPVPFFLVLDGITDPQNMGALIRSADAAGCTGVIVPKDNAAPITAVVVKASAGAIEHQSICRVVNLSRALAQLQEKRVWTYGLAGEESISLYEANLVGPVAIVVGSEGSGIRKNVRKYCDQLLSIPMGGMVSSLNASVATGVALFEKVRQEQSGRKE